MIGRDHSPPSSSYQTCMESGNIKLLYEHPRPHDFTTLHSTVYDHNDP